jgi:hypothetical protein
MANLDLTSLIDQVRLRCGDYLDLPYLPDSAYQHALDQSANNVPKATVLASQWILAQLAFGAHRKMAQLEVYGNQMFDQYKQYLVMITKDPSISQICPIPYSGSTEDCPNPLVQFVEDWNDNYVNGTQSELLHEQAIR